MAAPIINRIGKYEVIEIIGRGGMGLVYRAFDRQLSRQVAIKTVTEGLAGDQEMMARFYREAAKTGALKHPNIIIVYDLGEQDGFPYIVMEYLSGDPPDRLIRSRSPVSVAFKIKIIEQVCYALAYAHRNDVIHRDVKPGNVIVQPDGVAKLLDFGIATQESLDGRLTRTGHVIGTVQYMAPERSPEPSFRRTLGHFLGRYLAFSTPHRTPSFQRRRLWHSAKTADEPPLSNYIEDYPHGLDAILEKALAKNPNDRYATADEMADHLSAVGEDVKREQILDLFWQGQKLVDEQQFTAGRGVLLQLLKLDGQHSGARQLLASVQQSLSKQQRADRLRQLRSQADEARNDKRFQDAIALLQEALTVDPSDAELSELLKSAQQKQLMCKQVEIYLRQADRAREKGDLQNAQAVIARAMEIDKEDSRVRAAYAALIRQIEEREAQARTKKLLESARAKIDARHFTAALELLEEAEQIDPSNPALISLIGAAKSGREQEQRRRILEQLQAEVALATTAEQLAKASRLVDEALTRMPTEPLLLKFKVQLVGQLREAETRKRVDEVVQRCRSLLESSPREALTIVNAELRQIPANQRLLSLQSSIEEQLSRWTLEESRADYLARSSGAAQWEICRSHPVARKLQVGGGFF